MARISALIGFAIVWAAGWTGVARAQSCVVPYTVGFRAVTYGSVKAGLWYPTAAKEAPYSYFAGLAGSVALNGSPASCGRLPLVVFSHAYGGCGTQSVFFTEELARRGYIVVAPDHHDALCSVDGVMGQTLAPTQESFLDPASWTDATYADRKGDVELTLDTLLMDPLFSPLIDGSRIAIAGHSLGGYTAFGLAGGWPSWKDSRLRAALLFSPYVQPFQSHGTVGAVQIPVMYQGAQFDIGITPFLLGKDGAFAASQPPKFLPELVGGTHFEWTVLVCGSQPTVSGCLNASSNARIINTYAFAFLDHYLKGADMPLLFAGGAGLAAYQRTSLLTAVSAASLRPGVAPDSLLTGFGEGLAGSAASAGGTNLPLVMDGLSAVLTDALSVSRNMPIGFVSPNQINLLVPPGTSSGPASLSFNAGSQTIASGTVVVSSVAPSLFAANAGGTGIAAAQFVSLNPDGGQKTVLAFDPATLTALPFTLDPNQTTYLVLYGTGLRGKQSVATITVGGVPVPLAALAAQSQYAGLDQVNAGPLPVSLAGRGMVGVNLIVDGQPANPVTVMFR